ncbi:MAG TPA: GatB/YqeY domain-containing protein [Alphaproteobacteria bacterium]|nr:GatB/YqeY domain-containing protein [Alphaproteobacteria bacterium]HNS44390.1 GatB/YqeY domain-containing protein [Alphaproteobacteria bacterium]
MSEKRTELNTALKEAMKAKDEVTLNTIRMVISKMKEQDIEARVKGNMDGIDDGQLLSIMQGMIKQRQESAKMYRDGNRPELAEKEEAEIGVIEKFLPAQMSDDEVATAIQGIIAATGAAGIKDMGKVMGELKSKYAGQCDMAKAGAVVKQKLAG